MLDIIVYFIFTLGAIPVMNLDGGFRDDISHIHPMWCQFDREKRSSIGNALTSPNIFLAWSNLH